MTPLPSLRQIQFLIALYEQGSFQKAAQACGVTQSTLSAAIQEMEHILGMAVVDRANRRRLVFTPLGMEMLTRGREAINSLSAVAERARHTQEPLSWPLRMGVIPTIAPYLLPKILRPLKKSFPRMQLNIHEIQSAQLVDDVRQGKLDFGIMALPFDTKDLQVLPLVSEPFYCAMPHHTYDGQAQISIRKLEQEKLLLLADGHCLRDHALAACDMKDGNIDQNVSATSLSTLIQLVAQGYGMTLLPEMVVKDGHLPKGVKILPIKPAPMRQIGIVWRYQSSLESDIGIIGLATYRLMMGTHIHDDTCNIEL